MRKGSWFERLTGSWWKIWLLFFLYPLLVGLFVQFVALPYLFPSLHAGEGLMQGGDWLYFHRLAKDLAERIRVEGWKAWELRPEGQAPGGVAAIFYVLFGPHPWVMLPLNALVHATSALVLMFLLEGLVGERRIAFYSALPFLLFPSAMTWYTQIHKDGIFILGVYLFLWGWVNLLSRGKDDFSGKGLFWSSFWVIVGGLLVWIVRPYGLEILWFLGLVFVIAVSLFWLLRRDLESYGRGKYWRLFCLFLSLVILAPFVFWALVEGDWALVEGEAISIVWYDAPWLPAFVEGKFMGIARVREFYFRHFDPRLAGNIDWNVSFHSVKDVLWYIPRAMGIGLFAPFPRHWLEEGTSPGGGFTRKIAAGETLLVYLAMFFLPFSIISKRRELSLWAFLYFSLDIILIYALSVPNLGSLYRVRYGFLMLLVGMGLSGASVKKLDS